MDRYHQENDYHLESIEFDYLGGRYSGAGVLRWSPKDGFKLDGKVIRSGASFGSVELYSRGLYRPEDLATFTMRVNGGFHIATPRTPVRNREILLMGGVCSQQFPEALYVERSTMYSEAAVPTASANVLLALSNDAPLPDTIERTLAVGGRKCWGEQRMGGITFTDSCGWGIEGAIQSDARSPWLLRVNAGGKSATKPRNLWRWSDGLLYAMRTLTGGWVEMFERIAQRRHVRLTHRMLTPEPKSWGDLRFFGNEPIDKALLIHLIEFYCSRSMERRVAVGLVDHVFGASSQRFRSAKELIASTALEAALRTVSGAPFVEGSGRRANWTAAASMTAFRDRYLDLSWRKPCKRAVAAHERLRHRNAHPDWIREGKGSQSPESRLAAYEDLRFLIRFYGQMILALSGWRPMDPAFADK